MKKMVFEQRMKKWTSEEGVPGEEGAGMDLFDRNGSFLWEEWE